MAEENGMITPFEAGQVRESPQGRVISYGTSSYGYDVRCSDEFKIFTNINSAIVDPKDFAEESFVDVKADVCIIPPNSFALARTVEFFRIPRDVLTICLGKSTYARCFRGDTKVALVDGSAPTLEQMANRAEKGEDFWGYSMGHFGQIITTRLEAPRYIGQDNLLEIILDNNQKIHCTPEHQFMLRDGSMCQAHELQPNSSLMPLYRQNLRGYESVFQPFSHHWRSTYRLSDEWNLRHGIYEDAPNTHRHHVDHDRRNNRPWNIVRMDAKEHIRHHNEQTYGSDFNAEEHGAAIKNAFVRLRQDPQWLASYQQGQQQKAQRFWHDDSYATQREVLLQQRQSVSDATREKHRKLMLERYQNPEEVAKQAALVKQAWKNDDGSRRIKQAEIARQLRLRKEITSEVVRSALDETGSIRGAARLLECDRSVFRRFPEIVQAFKGRKPAPHNHKVSSVKSVSGEHDVYCLNVPEAGNFALEAGVFVHNCGIIVNVTPLEPEWEGHVTLEFSNTTPLPAKIYANEGVAQMLFFGGDEVCETSYKDRGGKYQGQQGVTLPKA